MWYRAWLAPHSLGSRCVFMLVLNENFDVLELSQSYRFYISLSVVRHRMYDIGLDHLSISHHLFVVEGDGRYPCRCRCRDPLFAPQVYVRQAGEGEGGRARHPGGQFVHHAPSGESTDYLQLYSCRAAIMSSSCFVDCLGPRDVQFVVGGGGVGDVQFVIGGSGGVGVSCWLRWWWWWEWWLCCWCLLVGIAGVVFCGCGCFCVLFAAVKLVATFLLFAHIKVVAML